MQERTQKPNKQLPEDQLAVFNQTFATFNSTIKQLNDSYANLQSRYQKLSDELTTTNQKLVESLDQNIQTRNFLHNVLESLTSGVITIDLEGKINSINKAGCEILNMQASEIIGRDYRSVLQGSLASRNPLTALIDGKKPYRSIEKQVQISEAESIPISVSSSRITDSGDKIVGALEVFVDLTELKRMEEEIARVKSLAALGEVAAVVAHEVRNPLSGIAGFAALLKRELGEDHPQVDYVNKIIHGVEKLNRSVSSLLEYARDLRHEPQEAGLNEFLRETVEFFRVDLNSRSSKSTVNLNLPEEPVKASFDRENLSGALINLLRNADESMPDGGIIEVKLASTKSFASIGVTDQGQGVPDDLKEKIFIPFYTTREGGTGLGLALVRKVIDAHRGNILVTRNSGRGSTFTLELPLRNKP